MATLKQIIGKESKSDSYEWFLYLFPQKKFFKELSRISNAIGVNVWEGIQDELWVRGLVNKRGEARMGKGIRTKIKAELKLEPLEAKIKRVDIVERSEKGKQKLIEYASQMGYLMIQQEVGLTMWNREQGFLLNAGTGFAYVYKTEGGFRTDKQYPIVGYFRLSGADVQGRLSEAMNGGMMWRSYRLGVRRRMFITRRVLRGKRISLKRKEA